MGALLFSTACGGIAGEQTLGDGLPGLKVPNRSGNEVADSGQSANDSGQSYMSEPDAGADAGTQPETHADAGLHDAGVPPSNDAGVGSGGDGGQRGCAGRQARLCDDFESYASGAYPNGQSPGGVWKASTSGTGTVSVDTTRSFSGSKSVLLTVKQGLTNQKAYLSTTAASVFPFPNHAMYGRMMVFIDAVPQSSQGPHWSTIRADGPALPGAPSNISSASYRLGVMNQKRFLANYQNSLSPDCYRNATTAKLPEKRWACVEWFYDSPNKEVRLWLDGQAAITVTGKGDGCVNPYEGTWYGPAMNALMLGINNYQASPIDVAYWLDDVILDTQRVGCPQ